MTIVQALDSNNSRCKLQTFVYAQELPDPVSGSMSVF